MSANPFRAIITLTEDGRRLDLLLVDVAGEFLGLSLTDSAGPLSMSHNGVEIHKTADMQALQAALADGSDLDRPLCADESLAVRWKDGIPTIDVSKNDRTLSATLIEPNHRADLLTVLAGFLERRLGCSAAQPEATTGVSP